MKDSKGQRMRGDKKGVKYEEAMKEAFSEIFQNTKEIERDTKIQRLKLDLERRRGSATAALLRETKAAFMQSKGEHTRESVSPLPPGKSSLPKDLYDGKVFPGSS